MAVISVLASVEISLPDDCKGTDQRVVIGVPFVSGAVGHVSSLAILDSRTNNSVPSVFRDINHWANGSVHWAQFSMSIDACCKLDIVITDDLNKNIDNSDYCSGNTKERSNDWHQLANDRDSMKLPSASLMLGSMELDMSIRLQDSSETAQAITVPVAITSNVEHSGLAGVQYIVGTAKSIRIDRGQIEVQLKLTVDRVTSKVDVELMLHNSSHAQHPGGFWDLGDKSSVKLSRIELAIFSKDCSESCLYIEEGGESWDFCSTEYPDAAIVQHSSGGKNWNSSNHVDECNTVLLKRRGWTLKKNSNDKIFGNRPNISVRMKSEQYSARIVPIAFWERFPCEISIKPKGCNIDWAAADAGGVDIEIQPGERFRQRLDVYMENKTQTAEAAVFSKEHVFLRSWLHGAGVHSGIEFGRSLSCDHSVDIAIQKLIIDPAVWIERREAIDEYGWRNHGDTFADHENLYNKSPESPLISHYNNQYDVLFGFCSMYMRTGESVWLKLADELARHCVDIDIYRTNEDRYEYNNGLFWHTDHYTDAATSTHRTWSRLSATSSEEQKEGGGGPAAQHCYTSGLCLHHLLCGDSESLLSARLLADWIHGNFRPDPTVIGTLFKRARRGIGGAQPIWLGFNRGTGNYIATQLDLAEATGEPEWLARAEYTLKHCIKETDNIEGRDLLSIEKNWSYTILLQAVVRYLHLKIQLDNIDELAVAIGSALVNYLRWMRENEAPYLARSEELDFPNDTWVAQDVRKHGLLVAGAILDPSNRVEYEQRADEIGQQIISTLNKSPECQFTRVQAILMSNLGVATSASYLEPLTKRIEARRHNGESGISSVTPGQESIVSTYRRVRNEGDGWRGELRWIRARLQR